MLVGLDLDALGHPVRDSSEYQGFILVVAHEGLKGTTTEAGARLRLLSVVEPTSQRSSDLDSPLFLLRPAATEAWAYRLRVLPL